MIRRRLLQLGFVTAALLAVYVADRTAAQIPGTDLLAARLQTLLVVAGRVVGGWAAGMAFRLQLAPTFVADTQLRLWLGVPLGVLSAWPLVRTGLPDAVARHVPAWVTQLGTLAPVCGMLLGLTLALAVSRSRR